MKRYVVAFIILAVIALAVFAYKPVKDGAKKVQTAIALANQYPVMYDAFQLVSQELQVSTADLNRITREWKQDRKELEAIRGEISDLKALVVSIPATEVIVPPVPPDQPSDLYSALYQIDTYKEIVSIQSGHIDRLTAINLNQGIIIEKQEIIIEKQDRYISEFEALIREHNRKSNRNIMIGTAIGIVIGMLL